MDSSTNTADARTKGTTRIPFFALLFADTVSLIGSALTNVAIPWFVLETTGSATQAGLVAFCSALASTVAAFWGGIIVDRLGSRRASILSDCLSGAIVALIPILHATVGLAFWQLLILVFLRSFFNIPGHTARSALIPDTAAGAGLSLERANSLIHLVDRAGPLVGTPLAALLIAIFGPDPVLLLDSLTFFASAASIALFMSIGTSPQEERDSVRDQIITGLRFLRRDHILLATVLTFTLTNFLESPLYAVLLPVYVKWTTGEVVRLGVLMACVTGGATVGAILFGLFGPRLPRRITFIGSFFLLGLPYWALWLTTAFPLQAAAFVLAGIAAGPINPIFYTIEQERVPPELRGRVFGMITALLMAVTPLGMLLAGYLVDRIGLSMTLVVFGAGFLLVTLTMLINPAFRQIGARSTGEPSHAEPIQAND